MIIIAIIYLVAVLTLVGLCWNGLSAHYKAARATAYVVLFSATVLAMHAL